MRKTLLWLALAIPALGALLLFVGLPWLVHAKAHGVLERFSERLGIPIAAADVSYEFFSRVRLLDVAVGPLAGAARPLVRVAELDVSFDPWSALSGPLDVPELTLRGVRVDINASGAETEALLALAARVKALFGGPAAADGEGGGSRLKRLPTVLLHDVQAELHLPREAPWLAALPAELAERLSGLTLMRLSEGALTLVPPASDDPQRVLAISGEARVADLDARVLLEATFGLADRRFEALVASRDPLQFTLADRDVQLAGWRLRSDGLLRIDGLALSQPGTRRAEPALRVRRLDVRLDTAGLAAAATAALTPADAPAAGAPGAPAADPQGLAAQVARIDFVEPQLFLAAVPDVARPLESVSAAALGADEEAAPLEEKLEDLAAEAASARPAGAGPRARPGQPARRVKKQAEAVRQLVATAFRALEDAFTAVSAATYRAGRDFPVREVHVERGSIGYAAGAAAPADAERLDNFRLDVQRSAGGRGLSFDASFQTQTAADSVNRVQGQVDFDTGDLSLRVSADRLPLPRYAALLPGFVRLADTSALHHTDLTLGYAAAARTLKLTGEVHAAGLTFDLPRVAAAPLADLELGVQLDLTLDLASKRLVLGPSTLHLNGLRWHVRATVDDYTGVPRLAVRAELPDTPAADVWRAIPKPLVAALEGMQVAGVFAWTIDLALDTANLESLRFEAAPDTSRVQVLSLGYRVDFTRLSGPFEHTAVLPDGSLTAFTTGPGSANWTPYGDVSPYVVKAINTTEDGSFFSHRGFSPFQIHRSIIANLEKGYFYRGASTVTQQLVKNLFLTREKTLARKLQEFIITWQIETALSKERIMELYLNVIEWGPDLYGIRNAAQHYFGKRPAELSLLESVFLVSLIPSPVRYSGQFTRGSVSPDWQARLKRIVDAMLSRGKIAPEEAATAAPYSPLFRGQTPPPDAPAAAPAAPADADPSAEE